MRRASPGPGAAELWDRAIVLARRHYPLLLTLSAVGVLLASPAHLVPLLVGDPTEPDATMSWPWMLYQLVVASLVYAATVAYVVDLCDGRPATPAEAFRRTMRHAPAVIGTALVSTLATLAGLVLLVLPGMWVAARLFAATTAVVVEGQGVVGATRRSWRLSRGHTGMLLGTIGVATLVSLGFSFWATSFWKGFTGDENRAALLGAVSQVPVTPFIVAVCVLSYIELRDRHDGDDLELALRALPPAGEERLTTR